MLLREQVALGADRHAGERREAGLDAGDEVRRPAERRHRGKAARRAHEEIAGIQERELMGERQPERSGNRHVVHREESRLPLGKPADHEEVDVGVPLSHLFDEVIPLRQRRIAVHRRGDEVSRL